MDIAELHGILQLCLSGDLAQRKAGEERLKEFQYGPGHLVLLLQTIVQESVDLAIRQVASIHFKNLVGKEWEVDDGEQEKFSEQDKKIVRDNLLEAIIQAPHIIRTQLGECMKSIVHADYPQRWPQLVPLLDSNMKAGAAHPQRLYGALYTLRILARKYEFRDEDERAPLVAVVAEVFPYLLSIFQGLLAVPSPPIEVAELLKLLCKIFWSTNYLEIAQPLLDTPTFTAWMTCFHSLIERPVPLEGQPTDPDVRKNWPWWKVRKWALHIVNRLFSRFGDPKYVKESQVQFARNFSRHCATKFLHSYLNVLAIVREGGYLPDRVVNLALSYLTTAIPKKEPYQAMKAHMDVILFQIIFPLMCFSQQDEELWQEDPHEYVRKGYDIIEDMYSPRTAAINFVTELVRKRGADNLPKFITFIVNIFTRYTEAPPEQKPFREKDGALLAIGALADRLKQQEPYKSALEQMLLEHVLPDFQNSHGHLRAKAAWVAGQYADIDYKNVQNFNAQLQCIVNCLRDPDLPVRVDAVVSLRSFVEAIEDLNLLRPILPQLLDEFFKLMNEVENEDLVFTLETIVDKFGEEMAPFALGLVQNLAAAFWKFVKADEDNEEEDMGALAAVGCLRAISTILESISSLPHLYPQLEPILLPILKQMLTSDGQDVYEEIMEILSYVTYFSPSISPQIWALWPLLIESLREWAVDYFENMLVPLDNFISRGTDHFLTAEENYPKSVYDLVEEMLNNKDLREPDLVAAPKLFESVLQNCRGRVDAWVEQYVKLALTRYKTATNNYLKTLLISVAANALYYNPVLCLQALERLGATGEFFRTWFAMLYEAGKKKDSFLHFRREHDKKVAALGLTSLLLVPENLLPADLQPGMGQVVKGLLRVLAAYKEQRDENIKAAEEAEDDVDDDDSEGFEAEELGEGGEDGAEIAPVSLSDMPSRQRKFFRDSDDEEDSDDDDWLDEDEEYVSPIDDVDAFIFFADAMKNLSSSNPQRFQQLTGALDFTDQAKAHGLAQYADVRRQEFAKEQEEKAKDEEERRQKAQAAR